MKFCHLHNLPDFPKNFLTEALNCKYDSSFIPNQFRAPSSYSNSEFVKNLAKVFGKPFTGIYIKNMPYSYYDWHTDIARKCSINWVLKSHPSALCLYRTHVPVPENFESNRNQYNLKTNHVYESFIYDIEKVDYTLYKPTLLNTEKEHCVINPSSEERIIYSLTSHVPFDELKDYLINL